MLYKGDFRSLDQSVDKKGQLYSVRIFTGYNPYDANVKTIGEDSLSTAVGPYPTKKITAYISGMSIVKKDVPDNAVQLTMCDHPFVVNYAGDPNNIHKPYRCSSATVSFLQENLNTDFVNSLGNGVMVMLLKWKNEVVDMGNYMSNTETGEVLNKKTYRHYDDRYGAVHTYWTGYMPWEYDKFCYEIEWVGFATPEMLNVEYDNLFDRFTLNCQDALSTLQYTKFVRNEQMELMSSSLTRMLYTLGVYKDIYITNAVHMSGAENDAYSSTPIVGNPLQWIAHQEDNYINEDSENMKYLEVLEDMMEYLSLTAIPYKDQLWIVSAEGLAQGHTVYTHYRLLNNPPRLWTLPAELVLLTEGTGYSNVGEVDIVDTAFLTKDDFCGGTDLSSNVMYNKVKVVCDEMRIDPLMPDLSSDDYFEPETAAMDQPMAVNLWDRYQRSGSWVEDHYHYFEMYANRVASGVEDIKFYKYYNILSGTPTPFNWGITPTDPVDADLMVTHHESYSGQSSENPIIDWLHGVVTPPSSGGEYYSNISMMVDMMDTSVNSRTEIPTSLNYTRYILLATPGNYTFNRKLEQSYAGAYDWDDKTTYWNPMLYMKSKPFFGNGKQYLNLTGDFIFNNNFYEGNVRYGWYPYNPGRTNNEFRFDANYNYLWVKVKCGKYWLTDNGRNSYSWTTTESFCRLWLDNAGLEQNADWRGKTFSFETTVRGVDGISIKLPINEGFGEPMQLEIWFDRPMGPAAQYDSTAAPEHNNSFLAQSTLIKDMNINIYSSEYVESRKRKNPDRDNTEYSNPIVDGAVEEMPEVNLIHSSCDTAGLSYSETALRTQRLSLLSIVTRYRTNPKIMSDGVGQFGLPEQVKIEALRNHGITPTVVMKTNVYRNVISPISRAFWSWLNGKSFIVDSMDIDYEYEQVGADLVEVKQPSTTALSIERVNNTRNYYRTRDIIFNGHIARRIPVTLAAPTPATSTVVVMNSNVHVLTDDESVGSSRLNVDWATGQIRLTVPSTGGISASRNSGGLITITTD